MSEKPHHHFHNNAAFLIDFTTFGSQIVSLSSTTTAPSSWDYISGSEMTLPKGKWIIIFSAVVEYSSGYQNWDCNVVDSSNNNVVHVGMSGTWPSGIGSISYWQTSFGFVDVSSSETLRIRHQSNNSWCNTASPRYCAIRIG